MGLYKSIKPSLEPIPLSLTRLHSKICQINGFLALKNWDEDFAKLLMANINPLSLRVNSACETFSCLLHIYENTSNFSSQPTNQPHSSTASNRSSREREQQPGVPLTCVRQVAASGRCRRERSPAAQQQQREPQNLYHHVR